MKKRRLLMVFLLLFVVSSSVLLNKESAKANTASVIQIEIEKHPSKTLYTSGEELDLSDMVVKAYYSDGSTGEITDYQVNFDSSRMGLQPVIIRYQYFSKAFFVTVTPEKPKNISILRSTSNSTTLTWDEVDGNNVTYGVYKYDEEKDDYILEDYVSRNTYTVFGSSENLGTYKISTLAGNRNNRYESDKSEAMVVAGKPLPVTGLKAKDSTTFSISLEWSRVSNATGYIIYRRQETDDEFIRYAESKDNNFIDEEVEPGTSYRYRVSAYILDEINEGDKSVTITSSTEPSNVNLRYKAGEEKVRLSWNKIKGADYYDVYFRVHDKDDDFYKIAIVDKGEESVYLMEDLITGNSYSIYMVVRRIDGGKTYESKGSNIISFEIEELLDTSTHAILFEDFEQFQSSAAYRDIEFFRENIDFDKSIIIPGLATTNVAGFSSTSMIPQGLTFAEDYLLMTAYDMASEENSVVYVMDKESGDLLTTVVLESQTHAGGIAYDGTNVWISVGRRVVSVPFEIIDQAAKEEKKYVSVDYQHRIWLGINASYMTYHDGLLWVGSYNELETTIMHSYDINYDEAVEFTKIHTVTMPTRVQGVAFTDDGHLIISRSCQLYAGLRGYMRQLDVYQPDFSGTEDDENRVILGSPIRVISMPTMNEEIAIDGEYLYVNFESAAFANASYKFDRIATFKLSSIIEDEKVD